MTPQELRIEDDDERNGGATVADLEALLFVAERPFSRTELRTVARLSARGARRAPG